MACVQMSEEAKTLFRLILMCSANPDYVRACLTWWQYVEYNVSTHNTSDLNFCFVFCL
jgi:hypothetical protein